MSWGPSKDHLPADFLPACLLLLVAEEPAHGYQLCEQLGGLGMEVDSGTVYRRLRSMEDDGVIASQWVLSDSGPPRRSYVVTPEGRHQLHRCALSIRSVVDHLVGYTQRCARLGDGLPRDPVRPGS